MCALTFTCPQLPPTPHTHTHTDTCKHTHACTTHTHTQARMHTHTHSLSQGAVTTVISCKLPDLLSSTQSNTKQEVWEHLTKVPFVRAGCAAINGKLVLASGIENKQFTANTVQSFDPVTSSWTVVGKMPAARSSCSIAVLGGAQIMLMGEYVDPTNWTRSLTRDVMATVNLQV